MRQIPFFLVAILLSACSNPDDQAAKERIFSPEDPPRVLQAAQETLEPASLQQRPPMVERIFSISAREAAFRIGPHHQEVKARFSWSREGKTVGLSEDRKVIVEPGGDFHVRIENDGGQGMEWIRVGGVSYSRSRHAKFRERRRDRGSSEHVLEDAYASLRTFHRVVHGAMKLSLSGSETIEGRRAHRYEVALGEPWERKDEDLPPVIFPKGGPDEDTRLRLEALEKGKAVSLRGTLWVDEETAVPLKADLKSTVEVTGTQGVSSLEFAVLLTVGTIGAKTGLQVPEHLEDAPRPPGAVGVLKAYDLKREEAGEEKEDN